MSRAKTENSSTPKIDCASSGGCTGEQGSIHHHKICWTTSISLLFNVYVNEVTFQKNNNVGRSINMARSENGGISKIYSAGGGRWSREQRAIHHRQICLTTYLPLISGNLGNIYLWECYLEPTLNSPSLPKPVTISFQQKIDAYSSITPLRAPLGT